MNVLSEFDPGVIVKFVVLTIAIATGTGLARLIINKRAQKKAELEKQGQRQDNK